MATAYPKPPPSVTGIRKEPDLVLGEFPTRIQDGEHRIDAVLELKSPGTSLDAPQNRAQTLTPVQQAFDYGRTIPGVRWVLVSDMETIRLYSIDSQWTFETFNLAECARAVPGEDPAFRRLVLFLHHDYLIQQADDSPVSRLRAASSRGLLEIADGFYSTYSAIRSDIFRELEAAARVIRPAPTREELIEALQRLLDRLLFLYYCEDHPDQLIPRRTVEDTTSAAARLPGPSSVRIYQHLKALFREVDTGSPPASGVHLDGYNGELFKPHRIVDCVDLPDTLAQKPYEAPVGGGQTRVVRGAWGLHAYDFWQELDEHVLGRIFEESLSDLVALRKGEPASEAERLAERKRGGIYYTTRIISDFLAESALSAVLRERPAWNSTGTTDPLAILQAQASELLSLRIADLSCGSGAFLVSVYRQLLGESWRISSAVDAAANKRSRGLRLEAFSNDLTQAQLLRSCVYGVDLLPQAVELAKLSLWLRSARRHEKVADLGHNIAVGDSLDTDGPLARLGLLKTGTDLVIGNPPWGGGLDETVTKRISKLLGLDPAVQLDSWELFLRLAIHLTRPGGRIAMVLPDSLLYPDKADTRRYIFETTKVEKVHYLGPDWFGPKVRMATLLVQLKKGEPSQGSDVILAMMLSGEANRRARSGELPLAQLEAQYGRLLPAGRSLRSPTFDIEVFRDTVDDEIIGRMLSHSVPLSELCNRARGEEMSKGGALWVCPSCMHPTVPGVKRKGGELAPKICPTCGHTLESGNVTAVKLVVSQRPPQGEVSAPFLDGDDVNRRYVTPSIRKWIRLGVPGVEYKPATTYIDPKILIRQAGVGVVATLDESGSYCPQSVYLYRLKKEYAARGISSEFVLAALLSRTMAYFVFKRFSEVDPAKAHAKLTHDRLATFPIPRLDLDNPEQSAMHAEIQGAVRSLLSGQDRIGSEADLAIESKLRSLWGLSAEDGAHINGEFANLPESQVVLDLFPGGRPKRQRFGNSQS